MTSVYITADFDVREVAKDFMNYDFENDIELPAFIELVDNLEPDLYNALAWRDVLDCVKDPLPDDMVEMLVASSGLDYSNFIYQSKLSTTLVKKLIAENLEEITVSGLMEYQTLTGPQFKLLLASGDWSGENLADVIVSNDNFKYAKYVVQNAATIFSTEDDLNDFRYHLFSSSGDIIISDNDSTKIFGFKRPTMSSQRLRGLSPCAAGWRRVLKWTPRNDTEYAWNEFIAHHALTNREEIDEAKSDLAWLGAAWVENNNPFLG